VNHQLQIKVFDKICLTDVYLLCVLKVGGKMRKTVMLVEDEPNIIEAISFVLSRDGWNVVTHSNGHDAFEVILSIMPSVIILDVMLPKRNGYEILRDIRENSKTKEIPVIVLTAKGQKKDRETAEKLGSNLFMTKPFSNSEVLEAVRQLVDNVEV
jgi:DNA-binding response OmpR family regulator